jgi:hydrogenase maturation factor
MQSYLGKASPPSDDKRWRIVEGTMRRNGHQEHALIEALHTVQESFGFLDDEAMEYVAVTLRDLTRGGQASALVEIAETAHLQIDIEEASIPVQENVQAACEILGFDPIYVASEGRFVAFVPAGDAERAQALMCAHPLGAVAAQIGHVASGGAGAVTMLSRIGVRRIVDMLSGEQLPRIC